MVSLEHLIKLPYAEFSQWENGGQLHQAEYEVYTTPELSAKGLVIKKKVACSETILAGREVPEGYRNSFREER